jgi:hypothetical protein
LGYKQPIRCGGQAFILCCRQKILKLLKIHTGFLSMYNHRLWMIGIKVGCDFSMNMVK